MRVSGLLRYASLGAALLLLGLGWAFASPHGSSADDDFHLTTIWCSHGYSSYCEDAGDGVGVFVPRVIAYPACYVNWPAGTSAACTNDLTYEAIYTTRVNPASGGYPEGFYWTMGLLAGKDVPNSVQAMRILNVIIAVCFLIWAVAAVQPTIRRAVVLAWGVGAIPLTIFFVASTNPSSWVITGVGLYWAFLLSVLKDFNPRSPIFWNRVLGVVASATLALVARRDAGIYLMVSTVAVVILTLPSLRKGWKTLLLASAAALSVFSFVAYLGLRGRYLSLPITWPGAQTATDQPNPILKTFMEIPSFIVGLIGGQRPAFVISDSGVNQGLEGYRPTGLLYGLGWAEVSLPSAVGLAALVAVLVVVVAGLNSYRLSRVLALCFVAFAVLVQIITMRAMVDFIAFWEIQPRYFLPISLVFLGLAALVHPPSRGLLTRAQGWLAMLGLGIAGSVAWMATAGRYAIGPDAAFTNFGQVPDWWWEVGPSRLVWFLIVACATGLWAWATIWNFGVKPVANPAGQLREKSRAH